MVMIILLHILIAISSLVFTTYTFFNPSKSKLQVGSLLVTLTLASGTYLVINSGAALIQACTTGLVYLAIVTAGLFASRHKLATQTARNQ